MRFLLLGAGNSRARKAVLDGRYTFPVPPITLDIDPECGADVIHDLNEFPYPFGDNEFDEVHAYEVLEHCGSQGDWRFFFAQFSELWRILKPGGTFHATFPTYRSEWAWGDPGHTRVLPLAVFTFLSQKAYAEQVGKTTMTDYRSVWRGDFDVVVSFEEQGTAVLILRANK